MPHELPESTPEKKTDEASAMAALTVAINAVVDKSYQEVYPVDGSSDHTADSALGDILPAKEVE